MTLLRLAARCPRCNHAPRLRIYEHIAAKYHTVPADEVMGTVQCHRCGKIYILTAEAYQKATAA